MASKLFKSVILGPPGSGKGTISARIVNTFNLEHVSSGDRLRQNIKERTSIGLEAEKHIKGGKLVPDDVMIKFICQDLDKTRPVWLLDGFPRTEPQAQALWEIHKLDVALNLVVPYSVIIDRVKDRWVHLPSGRVYNQGASSFNPPKLAGKDDITGEPLVQRDDDKPAVVTKRLELYDQMTRPVTEFYRKKGILHEFAGNTSDEIWPKVLECLATYIPLQITKRA